MSGPCQRFVCLARAGYQTRRQVGRALKGGGADAAEWKDGHSTGTVDGIQVPGDTTLADKWWQITVALGSIAFAYSYSYILLEMTARPPPLAPLARRPCLARAVLCAVEAVPRPASLCCGSGSVAVLCCERICAWHAPSCAHRCRNALRARGAGHCEGPGKQADAQGGRSLGLDYHLLLHRHRHFWVRGARRLARVPLFGPHWLPVLAFRRAGVRGCM